MRYAPIIHNAACSFVGASLAWPGEWQDALRNLGQGAPEALPLSVANRIWNKRNRASDVWEIMEAWEVAVALMSMTDRVIADKGAVAVTNTQFREDLIEFLAGRLLNDALYPGDAR